MSGGVTHYDVMPIPPIETQTHWFEAGSVAFGVEYRLLNDAIAAAHVLEEAAGADPSDGPILDDSGVSIHVCDNRGTERLEHLRFDCFAEDPHYHYISWNDRSNDMIHIDPIADGDPLSWALDRIRTRLPEMLARAGAGHLELDRDLLERVLPRVTEAAYRARYHRDDGAVLRDALGGVAS
jgi:hypothetical protein